MNLNDNIGIVFLHGWGTAPSVFVKQLDFFKGNATVITPNLYDLLQESKQSSGYSIDAVADSIADEIVDSGIKSLFIVGWSMGGIVAMKVAERLPNIVKSIVFCGFNPIFVKSDKNPHGMSAIAITKLKKRLEGSVHIATEEFMKLVFYGEASREQLALESMLKTSKSEPSFGALNYTLSLLEHGDYTDELKKITAKTLIIHGANDKLCPTSAVENMSKTIKNCAVEFIEGACHAPFFTSSAKFNRIFNDFIQVAV